MCRMKKMKTLFYVFLLILLNSCVEKTGYYEAGQKEIIDNLTNNKSWERNYHAKLDNGDEMDVHESWTFKDNASGSYKSITTYEDGRVHNNQTYFNWSFTTPDFSVIYMDYGLYWEIKKLTIKEMHIYETYDDPVTIPGQSYRDYQEFQAVSHSK